MAATDIQQWAPVASAALAAVAAGASWRSVRQNREQWLASQSPDLVAQLVDNEAEARMELHVLNAGSGVARGVRFCLVLGTEYVTGYAGPILGATLKTDETREVITDLKARQGQPYCVVTCLDGAGRAHSFDIVGGHQTRRARERADAATDPIKAFQRRYESLDLTVLTKVGGRARRKQMTSP